MVLSRKRISYVSRFEIRGGANLSVDTVCAKNETVDLSIDTSSIVIGGSKGFLFVKRLMDIILSATGLLFLFIPMVVIGILIKADSKGPAIYSQVYWRRSPCRFVRQFEVFALWSFTS